MTVNDKLQNFRDINLEDARARLKEQLDACGAELDAAFEKHKEEREKAIRERLREEETALKKELNRTFSQKQAEMRQQVSAKEKSIREELFEEASARLKALRGTPDYVVYLKRKIHEALAMAGTDRVTIYLDPEDEHLLKDLSEKTGVKVRLAEEPFGGGMQALIHARNILIDNSFDALTADVEDDYTFSEVVKEAHADE